MFAFDTLIRYFRRHHVFKVSNRMVSLSSRFFNRIYESFRVKAFIKSSRGYCNFFNRIQKRFPRHHSKANNEIEFPSNLQFLRNVSFF